MVTMNILGIKENNVGGMRWFGMQVSSIIMKHLKLSLDYKYFIGSRVIQIYITYQPCFLSSSSSSSPPSYPQPQASNTLPAQAAHLLPQVTPQILTTSTSSNSVLSSVSLIRPSSQPSKPISQLAHNHRSTSSSARIKLFISYLPLSSLSSLLFFLCCW